MMRALFRKAKTHIDARLTDLQQSLQRTSMNERRQAFLHAPSRSHAHFTMLTPKTNALVHNGPSHDQSEFYAAAVRRERCKNPMLVSLLDQQGDSDSSVKTEPLSSPSVGGTSMLSALLGERDGASPPPGVIRVSTGPHPNTSHSNVPHGNVAGGALHSNVAGGGALHSNVPHGNIPHGNIPHGNIPHGNIPHSNVSHASLAHGISNPIVKVRKPRKRKSSSDMRTSAMAGRNAKRKPPEDGNVSSPNYSMDHNVFDRVSPPVNHVSPTQMMNRMSGAMHGNPGASANALHGSSQHANYMHGNAQQSQMYQQGQPFSDGNYMDNNTSANEKKSQQLPPLAAIDEVSDKGVCLQGGDSKPSMLANLLEDSRSNSPNATQSSQRESASFLASKSPGIGLAQPGKVKHPFGRSSSHEFKAPENIKNEPGVRPTDLPILPNKVLSGQLSEGGGTPSTPTMNCKSQTPSPQRSSPHCDSPGHRGTPPLSSLGKNSYINAEQKHNKNTHNSLHMKKEHISKNHHSSSTENSPAVNSINLIEDMKHSPVHADRVKKSPMVSSDDHGFTGKKEVKRSPVRESITVKLNTKDCTAKTYVKQISEGGTKYTKEISRSKSSSKLSRTDSEKTYDFVSDSNEIPLKTSSNSSSKMKKYKSEEFLRLERKQNSKHLSSSSDGKRKRDESKREKSLKKKKMRSSHSSSHSDGSFSNTNRLGVEKLSPTTIKITTGKHLSSSKSSLHSSKTSSSSVSPHSQSSKSHHSSKQMGRAKYLVNASKVNRSKSEPGTTLAHNTSSSPVSGSKLDHKLKSNPTVKLKPVLMTTSSTSVTTNVTNTSSKSTTITTNSTFCTTMSSSISSANKVQENIASSAGNTTNTASSLGSNSSSGSSNSSSNSSSKSSKSAPVNVRRNSLTAVIDKLKKNQTTPPEIASLRDKKELEKLAKKDPIAHKNKMDMIRREILMAGTGAGAPSKEGLGLKSFRKTETSRVSDPRKSDMSAKSVLGSTPTTTSGSQYGTSRPSYNKSTVSGSRTNTTTNATSSNNASHHNANINHIDSSTHMHNKANKQFNNSIPSNRQVNNIHASMNNVHGAASTNKTMNNQVRGNIHPSNARKSSKIDDSDRLAPRHFLDVVGKRISAEQEEQMKRGDHSSDSSYSHHHERGHHLDRSNGDSRTSDMRGNRLHKPENNHKSEFVPKSILSTRTTGSSGSSSVEPSKLLNDNKENSTIQITENKPTEIRTLAPKPRDETSIYEAPSRTLVNKYSTVKVIPPVMNPDSDVDSDADDGLVIDEHGSKDKTDSPMGQSPSTKLSKSSSHGTYNSPIKSPRTSSSPVTQSSRDHDIDDDLMDEALIL